MGDNASDSIFICRLSMILIFHGFNLIYFILGVSIVFPPNWNKSSHFSHEVYLKEAEG